MRQLFNYLVFGGLVLMYALSTTACMHEPDAIGTDPIDTTGNPIDTNSILCDPNKVYFENQVAPIFNSSCALSGCHDAIKHEEGIQLDSYENIIKTGKIKPFDLNAGDIYEKINETNPKDRMPPPPMNALSQEQKNLIAQWILQGASNDSCIQSKNCDTSLVLFSKQVLPIINTNCKTCHSGSTPLGNISLVTYAEIKAEAITGKLTCVVNWKSACVPMPKGGKKLDACSIQTIEAWIHQGMINN